MTHTFAKLAGAALASTALLVSAPVLAGTAAAGSPASGSPDATQSTQAPTPGEPATQTPSSTSAMQSSASMSTKATPTESVSSVTDAKTQLAAATVQDQSGQQIGQVTNVHTSGTKGKATSVDVALSTATGAGKVVSIKASKLSYDPSKNILVAQLSPSDLASMPTSSSSSMSTGGMSAQPATTQPSTPPSGY